MGCTCWNPFIGKSAEMGSNVRKNSKILPKAMARNMKTCACWSYISHASYVGWLTWSLCSSLEIMAWANLRVCVCAAQEINCMSKQINKIWRIKRSMGEMIDYIQQPGILYIWRIFYALWNFPISYLICAIGMIFSIFDRASPSSPLPESSYRL